MSNSTRKPSIWKVPLFDIKFEKEELEAVQDVINSGWLTMGEKTINLEKSFTEFVGSNQAIAVSSGTAALHLAYSALGIHSGDEVICPSLTFIAGANAIVYSGAIPVFADITSHDNLNISPEDIEAKITDRTKAIEVMHYAGYPCDMKQIKKIADNYSLSIIEDCAHAPGAEYESNKCGTLGDIGCFSFFSNKNMTTAEGGMITTNNDELAKKIRLMRSHGMTSVTLDRYKGNSFSYDVVELGFNYRIDEIRSAIGLVQLKKLNEVNKRRQKLVNIYKNRLKDVRKIELPFKNGFGAASYHIFPVILDEDVNRQNFMEFLKESGIQTSIHYPPIHLFKFYRHNFDYKKGHLSITESVAEREVTLPLYPSMSEETIAYVCDKVVEYLQKGEC